jgi:hypothetical protein
MFKDTVTLKLAYFTEFCGCQRSYLFRNPLIFFFQAQVILEVGGRNLCYLVKIEIVHREENVGENIGKDEKN